MTLASCRLIAAIVAICVAAGLSLLAAFGALATAIVAAIGFLILWPLRMRRARRARNRGAGVERLADQGGTGRDD
jgi:Flp pilus assembly protein TadB